MLIAPGPFGGAERVLVAGANGLAARDDCKVSVLLIAEARAPQHTENLRAQLSANVNVQTLVSKSRFDFALRASLRQAFAEVRPAIIHTHGYKAGIFAWLAGVRTTAQGWVMTHHGVTAHTRLVRLYEWFERQAMRRADLVLAVSRQMRDQLQVLGVPADKLRVVQNMLGLSALNDAADGAPNERPSILFLGRLSHEKGLDQLADAVRMESALCDPAQVRFDIVGDGPTREALEPGAPPSFLFHGFSSQPEKFLQAASAMVVPSRTEGMPMAVIEALAAGVPVIGFDVGGMAELVTSGQNGTLVEAENIPALAAALRAHLDNPCELLGGAAQMANQIRNKFSVENWCDETIAAYHQALGQPHG